MSLTSYKQVSGKHSSDQKSNSFLDYFVPAFFKSLVNTRLNGVKWILFEQSPCIGIRDSQNKNDQNIINGHRGSWQLSMISNPVTMGVFPFLRGWERGRHLFV